MLLVESSLRVLRPLDGALWRHQMEKISALLAICAGASHTELDVLCDLRLNKRLSKLD